MKGLMQKDLCLLLMRKQTMLLLVIIAAVMCLTQGGAFGIGYTTMLVAIMTVGTTSYDEFDNGYPFLMTLPITRRTYVIEKYVFCGAFGLAGWFMASALCVLSTMFGRDDYVRASTTWMDAMAFIPILMLIIAIMLPVQLKYGAEKSRIVLALVGGACMLIGVGAGKLFEMETPAFILKLQQMSDATVMAGLVIASLLLTAASVLCSLHIMEKKEF